MTTVRAQSRRSLGDLRDCHNDDGDDRHTNYVPDQFHGTFRLELVFTSHFSKLTEIGGPVDFAADCTGEFPHDANRIMLADEA